MDILVDVDPSKSLVVCADGMAEMIEVVKVTNAICKASEYSVNQYLADLLQ